MGKITQFEELHCWQMARKVVARIYTISNQGKLRRDYQLRDQMRRAAVSVMNNIAEGFGRYSALEFIRFLTIASSSCSELKSMLYVCRDIDYLDQKIAIEISKQIDTTQMKILAFIKYLKNRKSKTQTKHPPPNT